MAQPNRKELHTDMASITQEPASAQSGAIRESIGQRKDILALAGGIVFSFAFTGVIWLAGQRLQSVPHFPDFGPDWYYWRLMEPTFWTRLSAWGLYLLHQVALWGLIYYAQTRVKKYTAGLHPVNVAALGVNALFILLHLAQTHLLYDGLAQDVSIWSSQASVVLLLVMVLLMENPRRGLFFGKKAPISQRIVAVVRKYHGYVFAWAAVYTFWYHPMENSTGHLIGFVYMFLMMLQGSLFFTRIHVNKWWTLAQELTVLAHGTLVAVQQGNGMWPMFFFGFAGIFVITQMHGLGLSRAVKWGIFALYLGSMALVYSQMSLAKLWQPIAIPLIEYGSVLVLALIVGAGVGISRRLRGQPDVGAQAQIASAQK